MDIKDLEYLAKGKRGKVFTGRYKGKKVGIKVGNRAEIEGKWLEKLNKYKIGPKVIKFDKEILVYEFIEGKRIGECLKSKNVRNVIKKVFEKCRILDKLKIDKREMVNPYKHILIHKNQVKMIDFERCHKVSKAKNVTQFGEYIMRKDLVERGKLTPLLKEYKKRQSKVNFDKILKLIQKEI